MTARPPDAPDGASGAEFVDLQTHTTASDGALSPTLVVEAAKSARLVAIAITDHDNLNGLAEARIAGETNGVRIVAGVELSTHFGDDELHLLGLHLSDLNSMQTSLEGFQLDRVRRAEQIVAVLNRSGIPVTMDAVMFEAGEGSVGRPHIAKAMVQGGWVRDFREAFDKWLGGSRAAFIPKPRFDVAEGIALVHRAGGLAVWAHPGESASHARVKQLAEVGLDGIEVLHPSHPPLLSRKLLLTVEQLELVPSGGSDWHGTLDGYRKLGGQSVPREWLDMQDARVSAGSASVARSSAQLSSRGDLSS